MNKSIGILHPGVMGISVAASAKNSGWEVKWASAKRSPETRQRAEEHSLTDVESLAMLSGSSSILISVCPPAAAEDLADQVLSLGYQGLYVDANAIAPHRAVRIGEKMSAAGVDFVDGGIIGGPAWKPASTWLYLSGGKAAEIAACFSKGPLETEILSSDIGQASAIKMCFAAWTKGTTALLCGILASASQYGVWPDLEAEWERDWPGFPEETIGRVRRVTAKAWRFEGEMHEIASTFEDAGLPKGFHQAAAEIYGSLSEFKGADTPPELDEIVGRLLRDT